MTTATAQVLTLVAAMAALNSASLTANQDDAHWIAFCDSVSAYDASVALYGFDEDEQS